MSPAFRGILLVEDNAADVEFILASLDSTDITEPVTVASAGAVK